MKTEVRLITPQTATEMLRLNSMNRPYKQAIIDEYARIMIAGLWKPDTGESIKLSYDNVILDGQHRLAAIIKSNVSLPFLIISDLEKDIFTVIDQGSKRTSGDVLHIAGVENCNHIAAGIRRYFNLKAGNYSIAHVKKTALTATEALSLYSKNNKFWDAAFEMSDHWYIISQRTLSKSEYIGLYAFFYDLNKDDAFKFIDLLASGENMLNNNPIKQLRDKLMFAKINPKFNMSSTHRTALIFKAWNFYRKQEVRNFLKFNPEVEKYPIPT